MSLPVAALVVGLAAFVSLSYEIVWYRLLGFASGDPASIFGLLLSFYLLGLAGGALAVSKLCRDAGDQRGEAPWLRIALFICVANLLGYAVAPVSAQLAEVGLWPLVLPIIALSTACLGGILPLLSHYAVAPDERAGSGMSFLYAANIMGSVLGTLLTGYILLDVLPLRKVALLLALFGLGIAFVVSLQESGRRRQARFAAAGVLASAVVIWVSNGRAFDGLYEKLLYKLRFQEGTRFAQVVENRVGVIAVTKRDEVFSGGVYDGMILTDPVEDRNGILRAYAVAGMHPQPRRILIIGLATGAWAQVLAHTPGLERMVIVEINPGFLDVIERSAPVASLLTNPKVQVFVDDGRRWLVRNPGERFDAIVANSTFNWRSHSTNLLSAEYLELIRQHLAPGGLYYFNTTDSPHAVKTAFTVFPHGLRFRNFVAVSDSPLTLDRERWVQNLTRWEIDGRRVLDPDRAPDQARLAALRVEQAPTGAGYRELEYREAGLARVQAARVITDDNMATEWEHVFPALWVPR